MDASGDAVPGQQGSGMMFFPGTLGKTAFTAETTPSSRPWSGMDLERNLTGIREEGGLISFVYSGGGNVAVEGVTLNPADLHIDLLDSVQLVADVIPSNALDKTCDWYSSDRNVVTVNERGVVKAWAPGNADIKVSTRDGGFEATCHVTVIQNMAENRPLRIGQREVWLNWKKLKEMDRWLVEWKKASAAEYTVAGVVDSVYLIRGLQPATRYKVRLAGEKQGEVAVVMEQEVVTGEITAHFAAIGWIKGSYVTGEALEMGLVNVQADVVGEEWTVDGKEIPIDRKLILPVGEHVVKVRFKDKKGNEETIVRKIVIHD